MGWCSLAIALWLTACLAVNRARPSQALGLRLVLVVIGIPMLGLMTWLQGPFVGLFGLVSGAVALSIHRLPSWLRAGR